jgi:alkyldihydroxyacetonephosphate synthase
MRELIDPGPPLIRQGDEESLDVWGFRDSAFAVLPNGHVVLSGSRYPLSGAELPELLPWTSRVLGVDLTPDDVHESAYPPEVPAPREHPAFLSDLRGFLSPESIAHDDETRLRHGHGHTLEEMYAIKHGRVDRAPDLVVYPNTEDDVVRLVEAAARHDVCVIPYGGGTNVTDALRCPDDEPRMIVSVDLRRLNRIVWIDPENLTACIQAGAVGRHIEEQLAAHGFTLGHEPDSIEFSTLGGWIATNASGMKKNRYGNIEDLVLDVHVVTARGELSRAGAAPRESVGLDPWRWVFGSEGNFGIVTRAVVQIFRLAELQRYDSMIFRSFEGGVAFLHDLTRAGRTPASVRLVDNLQFQLSQTLKPKAEGLRRVKRQAEKMLVTRIKGFDPDRMVACTLVYEGDRDEVAAQERTVRRLARRHGGMRAGPENGRRGYQLTFGIAYLRDFVMKHYILGESLETSVPWRRVLELCDRVKQRIAREHRQHAIPGNPFISCRVTQVYQTGVCVYFYLAFYHKGLEEPSEVFAELERAARDEILLAGGSLSHHHGVGKLRRRFLPRIMSPTALEWSAGLKRVVDPGNVFGARNQLVGADVPAARFD